MHVLSSFVANSEAAEAVEPSQGALPNPSISLELFAAIYAAVGNPRRDGAPPVFTSAAGTIIRLCRHAVCQGGVAGGTAQAQAKRCTRPVD